MFWTRFPLLRLLMALCAGIVLGAYLELSLVYLYGGLLLFFLLWGLLSLLRSYLASTSYGILFGTLALIVFTGIGWLAQTLMQERHASLKPGPGRWWVEVQDFPKPTENAIAAPVRLRGVWQQDSFKPQKGRIMLYFQPDSAARTLCYGDQLVFKAAIQPLPRALNPQQFDYGAYLAERGFSGTAYLRSARWVKGQRGGAPLWRSLMDLRLRLLEVIRGWPVSPPTREVAQALLLGYRAALEDDLRQSFAQAGTMHVLAVSGLHVGIVYLVMHYLLLWMQRLPGGRWLQPLVIALLLWGFAILAGFAPSVVRAVVMFSFVALGRCFDRYTSVYNALLASAILLLVVYPGYLFQVGFQLSYAAVLTIVWVQPMLYRPLATRWAALNFPLALLTVSIAAQLGTAPLALYYFGQFPGLFWLANLWVVPLITLLMYGGFPLLIFSAMGTLPHFLFELYDWLMGLMIGGVEWIQAQQWGLLSQLDIGRGEVLLLYSLIIGVVWWLLRRRQFFWYWGLALIGLVTWQLWESAQQHQGIRVTAYAMGSQAAVGVYAGDTGYVLAPQSLLRDTSRLAYALEPHWDFLDLQRVHRLDWRRDTSFRASFVSYKKASMVAGEKLIWRQPEPPPPNLPVDWWWITEGEPPAVDSLQVKEVWLLSSRADEKKWEKWARKRNIPLYATNQGAIRRWWTGTHVGRDALSAFLWGGE